MTETLANGYSFESAQRELSNEYQHDRVGWHFKNLCVLVLWTKVASALEGLTTIAKAHKTPSFIAPKSPLFTHPRKNILTTLRGLTILEIFAS